MPKGEARAMTAPHARRRASAALVLLTAGPMAAGCSSTPFSNATDFDRTFIGAAQTWDLDKNGSVSCAEWRQYTSTSLQEVDANRDGALDKTEFAQLAKSDRLFDVANLAYYDLNKDSKVTADEFAGKPNLAFKLLDKNGDCQIDRNESVQVVGTGKVREKQKDIDQSIPRPGG
jgi:EF hand